MSATNSDDLFLEIEQQLSRNFNSTNGGQAILKENNSNLSNSVSSQRNDDRSENVTNLDDFSDSNELLEEIRKVNDRIHQRELMSSKDNGIDTLKEVAEGDLNISIQLNDEAGLQDNTNQNFDEINVRACGKNVDGKRRKSLLSKIFGPSKAERDYLAQQEAKQREELRRKASFILSKDKEQKIKVNLHSQITTSDASFKDVNSSRLNTSIQKENFIADTETHEIVRTYQPLDFSAYNENIKQLELKISHFNLVIGRNILPDRFKRRHFTEQKDPKEELSEVDKLYLAAFSDVSIPEDDVDLDEDSLIVDDPTEIEDLFDLADESLTDSMESAIMSQVSNIKQNLRDDIINEKEVKLSVSNEDNVNGIFKNFNETPTANGISFSEVFNRNVNNNNIKAAEQAKSGAEANVLTRYSAFLVDVSFLSVVCAIISLVIILRDFNSLESIFENPLYMLELGVVFLKSIICISLFYYAISYTVFKTSLGLTLLSYKLESEDGSAPKIRQVLIRVLCMPINFLLLFGALGQNSIHDRLSHTKLIKC